MTNEVGENCYLRTARRDWLCNGTGMGRAGSPDCPITITKGSRYIECVDSAPLYRSGNRYCLPCSHVQLDGMVDWTKVPAA